MHVSQLKTMLAEYDDDDNVVFLDVNDTPHKIMGATSDGVDSLLLLEQD